MNPPVIPTSPPKPFAWFFRWFKLRRVLIGLAWLVTAIVLFYAVENWRGARAQNKLKGEAAANGASLDPAALIPPPVPDDQNFTATPFFAPLFDFLPGTQTPRDATAHDRVRNFGKNFDRLHSSIARRSPLNSWLFGGKVELEDTTNVLEQLQEFSPILEELRAASHRPQARFKIRYETEDPWAILLPHLAVVKKTCQILSLRALTELRLGQSDQAPADIQLMLALTDSIQKEPLLISQLVRVACWQIAVQPIWEGLGDHRWSNAQLQMLQQRLEQFDFIASLKLALAAERAWGNRTIELIRDRRVRLQSLFSNDDNSPWSSEADAAFRVCPRGWFDQEQLNYNRFFKELFLPTFNADTKRIFPKTAEANQHALEQALNGSDNLITQHLVMAKLLIPALVKAQHRFAHAQSAIDEAVIACALERHRLVNGGYPETLEALMPGFIQRLPHDVISGEPFKYRREPAGGFILYSVGWNEADDGGVPGTSDRKSRTQDVTRGDWVWSSPTN